MSRIGGALLVLALAGCQTVQTTQPGLVGVDRKQSMLVSSKQINGCMPGGKYEQARAAR